MHCRCGVCVCVCVCAEWQFIATGHNWHKQRETVEERHCHRRSTWHCHHHHHHHHHHHQHTFSALFPGTDIFCVQQWWSTHSPATKHLETHLPLYISLSVSVCVCRCLMIAVVVPCATVHIFSYFFFCLNFVRLFPACRLSPSADLILLLSAAVAAAAVLCLPASLSVCLLSFLLFDALLNRVCPSFALIFWSFLSLSVCSWGGASLPSCLLAGSLPQSLPAALQPSLLLVV